MTRTDYCGRIDRRYLGNDVTVMGWVHRRRDHGGVIFIDLRDREGIVQVVCDPDRAETFGIAEKLRNEYCVAVTGRVRPRPGGTVNPNLPSGEVEILAQSIDILNVSATPPFQLDDEHLSETVRLSHRVLDLRRPQMQHNLRLRYRAAMAARRYLDDLGFVDIETPVLYKSTPEGARDFLVPSRVHAGEFYALPQSPQLFKQILMISGFDKYFQIVRCFRDEDLRADRQPEFTQIDLEMTFPQPDRVFEVVEGFLQAAFKAAGYELKAPFPRMTYDEAIRQYGIDKPDLRLPKLTDVRQAFTAEQLQTLQLSPDLPVVAIRIPKIGELSRKERDDNRPLFGERKDARLVDDLKRLEKSFPEAVTKIREMSGMQSDDLLVLVAGPAQQEASATRPDYAVYMAAGQFRVELARKYAERHHAFHHGGFHMLWVTDFPMFEYDPTERRWNAAHHPFTSPHEQDMDKLDSDPGAVRSLAYDVVLNGTELGSGSIRIHRQDIQKKIFSALGMTEEEAKSRFGFFLEALEYGTPPHGGIALGLDRIVMILAGAESLREVIPFPKTAKAVDLMVDAPTPVSDAQLKELGIRIKT